MSNIVKMRTQTCTLRCVALLVFLCILCLGGQNGAAEVVHKRPNIVIALADDLGIGDLEFMNPGSIAKTPTLNEMAASSSSIVFRNLHSEAACNPSRVAILTSRSPLKECMFGVPPKNLPVFRPNAPSIVKIAADHGYRTLFLGKFLESIGSDPRGWPSVMGFQNWTQIGHGLTYDSPCICRLNVSSTEQCYLGQYRSIAAMKAKQGCISNGSPDYHLHIPPRFMMESIHLADLFDEWLATLSPTDNFFVQISFRSVHTPYVASPELNEKCLNNEICNDLGTPKTPMQQNYGGCVHSIDKAVGMIRSSLRSRRPNDWDNTIVVFLSDNGPESLKKGSAGSTMGLKGRKLSLFEGLLNVPALMEWPARIRENVVTNAFVSIMDISVTFLDALLQTTGESDEVQRDGVSLLPFIDQPDSFKDFARPQPFGICSNTETRQTQDGLACLSLAMFDVKGAWKLIGPRRNAFRRKARPSSINPKMLYNVTWEDNSWSKNERSNQYRRYPALRKRLTNAANAWLKQLFHEFGRNCPGYYTKK